MQNGGRREGAGRKKGSPNKATQARQAEVAATGITPLAFLLETMRDTKGDPVLRFNAAKAAAPYVHPSLASVALGNADGKAFKVIGLSPGDEDL
jgi:hypothetical protein